MKHVQPFQCFICFQDYNQKENAPRILPQCGHTICSECLSGLLKSSGECPFDKKKFVNLYRVDSFPINTALTALMDESLSSDFCKHHGEKVNFFCMNDKVILCIYCAFEGGHRDHDVKPLVEIEKELSSKSKKLEGFLEDMDKCFQRINNVLVGKKADLEKVTNSVFEEMSAVLTQKKKEIFSNIDAFFIQERKKMNQVFGKSSPLKTHILSKISDCKLGLKRLDLIEILNGDISDLLSKLDYSATEEYIEDLKIKFKEITEEYKDFLDSQVRELSRKDLGSQSFFDKVQKTSHFADETFKTISKKLETDMKAFSAISSFDFTMKDGKSLEIITHKEPIHKLLEVEQWITAKECRLVLEKFHFETEEISIFDHVWNYMTQIESIKLSCKNVDELPGQNMTKFLSHVFINPSTIRELDLNFSRTKVDDSILSPIHQKALVNVPNLRILKISLIDTHIHNNTVLNLAKAITPLAATLETYSISLGRTKITEDVLQKLFVAMPKVKNFELNLDCLNITDNTVEKFINNSLKSMNSLEVLVLWLYETKISDQGFISLFNAIPPIKKFKIDLRLTKVRPETIKVFVRNKLKAMKSLKAFDIKALDDQIDKTTAVEIYELKEYISRVHN